jgi:DNA-binding CsgD family transcriptional regulator
VERFDAAREIGERSLAAYRAEGNVLGVIFDSTNLALVEAASGRFAAARAAASEAAELAEQTGDVYLLGCNLPVLARLAAIGGREAEAGEQARRAIELAEKPGYEAIALEARWTLGLAELSAGRPDAAAAHIGPVMEALEERGVVEPSVVPAGGDYAEALIRSGADFEHSLARLEQVAAAVGRLWALAAAARCRGLLAGDDDFDARFAAAFELHDAGPSSPFERARTELLYGERLRRARRRVDARVHLRRAIELFDELGAAPWSEKARVELRATGERIPRRDPTAPEKLTPQELQIALQVAEGKSNREVAAALFLSPKTVEFHLTRVYRKLEVHSRAELVRLFAASQAPPAAVA